MQLMKLKKGLRPLTIATGLFVGGGALVYADLDKYSSITTVLTNQRTVDYLQESEDQVKDLFVAKCFFYENLNAWKEKTFFMSSVKSIVAQIEFKNIVAMGTAAVPYIVEELEKEPSILVWALNMIYGHKITNNPNATITEACKLWIKILRRK